MPGTKKRGSKSEKTADELWRDLEKMGVTMGNVIVSDSNTSPNSTEMLFSRDPNVRSAFIRANNEADDIIKEILDDIESSKVEPPSVSYEDPCQSPVLDVYEAEVLRMKWTSMMDMPLSNSIHQRLRTSVSRHTTTVIFNPKQYDMKYFSPEFMAAFLGNLEEFSQLVDNLSKSEIERLLKKREGYLQFNPIFLPIIGAKIFQDPEKVAKLDKKDDASSRLYLERSQGKHMQLLEKLVELGADVNVHDLVGYTPLHHCFVGVQKQLNNYTLKMAEFLLKNGANVNAVDRFGESPLIECVKKKNEENIKFLISYKANPLLKNYEGRSALSHYAAKDYPEIYTLLREGVESLVKDERIAVENKYQVCEKCKGFAKSRCSACFFVWYCGVTCQKSDWIAHKATCKRMRQ